MDSSITKALQAHPRDLQWAAQRAAESKSVTVSEEEVLKESWVVVSTWAALKVFLTKKNSKFCLVRKKFTQKPRTISLAWTNNNL